LTRRGRVLVLLLLAVAVYGAFGLGRASAGSEPVGDQKRAVVVQPGDSLWSIAVRAMPQRDPRDAVAELRSRNHLSSSNLVAGQRLLVR
jgi:LysM repeat protein